MRPIAEPMRFTLGVFDSSDDAQMAIHRYSGKRYIAWTESYVLGEYVHWARDAYGAWSKVSEDAI